MAEARLNSQFFRNLTTASDRQSQNQLRRPQHVTEVQRVQNVLIATRIAQSHENLVHHQHVRRGYNFVFKVRTSHTVLTVDHQITCSHRVGTDHHDRVAFHASGLGVNHSLEARVTVQAISNVTDFLHQNCTNVFGLLMRLDRVDLSQHVQVFTDESRLDQETGHTKQLRRFDFQAVARMSNAAVSVLFEHTSSLHQRTNGFVRSTNERSRHESSQIAVVTLCVSVDRLQNRDRRAQRHSPNLVVVSYIQQLTTLTTVQVGAISVQVVTHNLSRTESGDQSSSRRISQRHFQTGSGVVHRINLGFQTVNSQITLFNVHETAHAQLNTHNQVIGLHSSQSHQIGTINCLSVLVQHHGVGVEVQVLTTIVVLRRIHEVAGGQAIDLHTQNIVTHFQVHVLQADSRIDRIGGIHQTVSD